MRLKLGFLSILLLLSVSALSQSDYSFLKGLMPYAKVNQEEYTRLKQKSNPAYYSPEGEKLTKQAAEIFFKNRYTFQEFVDQAKTEIKVIAFLPKNNPLTVGSKAPLLVGTTLNGQPIDTETLKGKVIVLNFWGVTCKPCIKEMPQLNKLKAKHANNQNIVFLALGEDNKAEIQSFLSQRDFTYAQVPMSTSTKHVFSVTTLPVNIVVDQQGTVQFIRNKYSETVVDEMSRVIDRLTFN